MNKAPIVPLFLFVLVALIGFNAVINIVTGRTDNYRKFDVLAKDGGFNDRMQPPSNNVITTDR